MMYGMWDVTYLLVILGALLCGAASWNVSRTYKKYSGLRTVQGVPAQVFAERLLRQAGIGDVRIEHIAGTLTDHYSSTEKVLRLSDSVYGANSIAALGVAAHECGHAMQDRDGYLPLKLRLISVPAANIGSKLSWPVILIGLVLGWTGLTRVGVVLFGLVVLFQLITLPVELDASGRAMQCLQAQGFLTGEELDGAGKVLRAAALTYVAALFSSILQLLRLILLTQGNNRRRR